MECNETFCETYESLTFANNYVVRLLKRIKKLKNEIKHSSQLSPILTTTNKWKVLCRRSMIM